jgi:hypothetical protein
MVFDTTRRVLVSRRNKLNHVYCRVVSTLQLVDFIITILFIVIVIITMKRIHHMASALRQRVLRSSIRKTSERMDPTVRAALARDVAEQVEQGEVNEELEAIEQDIETAKQLLQQSEAKETFLGQRCAQYRKALDERARLLRQEHDDLNDARKKQQLLQESSNSAAAVVVAAAEATDHEEGNTTCDISNNNNDAILQEQDEDLTRRLEKWEKDEDALVAIVETHKQILANCEEIRRKIKELERKRAECCAMAGECRDFLDTAAKAAAKNNNVATEEVVVEQEASSVSASLLEEEKAKHHHHLEMTDQINHESCKNDRHNGDDEEALDATSAV